MLQVSPAIAAVKTRDTREAMTAQRKVKCCRFLVHYIPSTYPQTRYSRGHTTTCSHSLFKLSFTSLGTAPKNSLNVAFEIASQCCCRTLLTYGFDGLPMNSRPPVSLNNFETNTPILECVPERRSRRGINSTLASTPPTRLTIALFSTRCTCAS